MSDAIITTIISSVLLLLGTVVTVVATAYKNRVVSENEQTHIKEQLTELKERVDEHNNYAVEIPLIKKDIEYIKERLKNG